MALVLVLVLVLAGAGAGAGVLVVLVLVRRVMRVFFARSLVQLPRTPPAPLPAPCGALRAAPANGGSYWLLATGYWPCVWGTPFGVLSVVRAWVEPTACLLYFIAQVAAGGGGGMRLEYME
jgi:hypothetical protein